MTKSYEEIVKEYKQRMNCNKNNLNSYKHNCIDCCKIKLLQKEKVEENTKSSLSYAALKQEKDRLKKQVDTLDRHVVKLNGDVGYLKEQLKESERFRNKRFDMVDLED